MNMTREEFLKGIKPVLRNANSVSDMYMSLPVCDTDLVISFICALDEEAFINVSKDLAMQYRCDNSSLMTAAFLNTTEEYEINSLVAVMNELSETEGDDIDEAPYVLRNKSLVYGAAGIIHTELLDALCDKVNDDLFVLPSSIHEVLLLPVDGSDLSHLYETVKYVNETQVRSDEWLSDNVYQYSKGGALCIPNN